MDSLIDGYKAVVIGARGGVGAAAAALIEADPRCGGLSRIARAPDAPFDVTDDASMAEAAAKAEAALGAVDFVFIATGVLTIAARGPEKALAEIDADAMRAAFAVNAVGPSLALKHFAPLLPQERRCLIAALSARVGSISDNRLGGWVSYRASKAALNQIIKTAAIELARTRPQAVCAALHPGTVATKLSAPYVGRRDTLSPAQSAAKLLSVLDGLAPSTSGGFFAYDGAPVPW